jgi:hypothetical protein
MQQHVASLHTLATGVHDNDNGGGGPALATDACKGNVGPAPILGKETSYGTDMAVGAVADNAEHCHEREA